MEKVFERLYAAKQAEQKAKAERIKAEEETLYAMRFEKEEGTHSVEAGRFKVSVTAKLSRSLDYDAYRALDLPENLGFVDLKPSINLKNLRVMERVDPAIVAKCVTVKPAKPSVSIEEVA